MTDGAAFDSRAYRDWCGRFATGITVVTMRDGDQPHGMTANAFTSVSLDPPLLLICVDKTASVREALERSGVFTVNILSEDQREIAQFFARHGREDDPDADAMGDFPYRDGQTGSPILDGTIGWADCRFWGETDAGDHTVVIGEVVDMDLSQPDAAPLLFFASNYRLLADPA